MHVLCDVFPGTRRSVIATAPSTSPRRTHAERSAATKRRLVDAAITSLVENGFARTTAVEVCRRAAVTRGALNHHFSSLSDLFVAALERLYADLSGGGRRPERTPSLEAFLRTAWDRMRRPEFKAVIEIWLAARNDRELGRTLGPAITRLASLFDPAAQPALARRVGSAPDQRALYRLAAETMIGLALGRATSPRGRPLAHEREVVELLMNLARERARS